MMARSLASVSEGDAISDSSLTHLGASSRELSVADEDVGDDSE